MPFLHKSEHSKYDLTNHQLILAVSTDTFFFWWAPDPKETVIFLANIINQSFKPATIPFLFPGSRPSKLQMQSISRFIWLMSLCKDRHAAVLGSRLMYIKCFWPVATSTFCCMLWLEMFAVHNTWIMSKPPKTTQELQVVLKTFFDFDFSEYGKMQLPIVQMWIFGRRNIGKWNFDHWEMKVHHSAEWNGFIYI